MEKPVVIVQLNGGLGNQLFQYAAGRAVAYRAGVPLKLDVSAFDRDPGRKYRLGHFNVAAALASQEEVECMTRPQYKGLAGRMLLMAERFKLRHTPIVLTERSGRFDPQVLRARGRVYLAGYWQSEKYFAEIGPLLRRELTWKQPPDRGNADMLRLIQGCESVSVHVRRGDYASDARRYEFHGVCSPDYYQAAVQRLSTMIAAPHFFIFSDDMDWTARHVRLSHPVTYVTHNGADRDYEDLRLMSQCKHYIIANSTFSWWGAWLCPHAAKVVIAPQKWFNKADYDDQDIVPPSWIRV